MDELMSIPEFCKNELEIPTAQYYAGVRAGRFPVIQTGPSKGWRMTRTLWQRYIAGEPIDERHFVRNQKESA